MYVNSGDKMWCFLAIYPKEKIEHYEKNELDEEIRSRKFLGKNEKENAP